MWDGKVFLKQKDVTCSSNQQSACFLYHILKYRKFWILLWIYTLHRLPVPVALRLVEILRASLSPLKADGVPAHLQVLSALRFYAEGTYQKGVGQDFRHPLSQAMISRIIERVTDAIIAVADNYIRFPHTREERILCAQGYRQMHYCY